MQIARTLQTALALAFSACLLTTGLACTVSDDGGASDDDDFAAAMEATELREQKAALACDDPCSQTNCMRACGMCPSCHPGSSCGDICAACCNP